VPAQIPLACFAPSMLRQPSMDLARARPRAIARAGVISGGRCSRPGRLLLNCPCWRPSRSRSGWCPRRWLAGL